MRQQGVLRSPEHRAQSFSLAWLTSARENAEVLGQTGYAMGACIAADAMLLARAVGLSAGEPIRGIIGEPGNK
jgi:hypothetical protein